MRPYIKPLLVAASIGAAGYLSPAAFEALQAVQAQGEEIEAPADEPMEAPAAPTTTTTTTTTAPSRSEPARRESPMYRDEEQLIPKSVAGKTVLGVVLVGCGWLFIFSILRYNRRSKAEGDLDQRLPLILQNVTAGWEKLNEKQGLMIDKAEARADRVMDEHAILMKQFIDFSTVQTKAYAEDLARTREQFTESQRRLHDRVDQNEKQHAECARKLEETEKKLAQLDKRQYDAALISTPAAAPAAAPALVIPPTGLTITPGLGSPGAHPAV